MSVLVIVVLMLGCNVVVCCVGVALLDDAKDLSHYVVFT